MCIRACRNSYFLTIIAYKRKTEGLDDVSEWGPPRCANVVRENREVPACANWDIFSSSVYLR